jgi:hypothetical protein
MAGAISLSLSLSLSATSAHLIFYPVGAQGSYLGQQNSHCIHLPASSSKVTHKNAWSIMSVWIALNF